MNRLRKLVEIGSHEERTGRTAYVLKQETLPEPNSGFKWIEDSSFNAAEAVLSDARLKSVYSAAITNGYALVEPYGSQQTTPFKAPLGVFTLEIEGRPIVSFEAKGTREAQELAKEDWLQEDFMILVTEGQPLWDGKAPIRIRLATEAETARYRDIAAEADEEGGDIVLAFLVTLDGPSRR
jgi:hypothetical protein